MKSLFYVFILSSIQILNNRSLTGCDAYVSDSDFGSVWIKHFEMGFSGLINPREMIFLFLLSIVWCPLFGVSDSRNTVKHGRWTNQSGYGLNSCMVSVQGWYMPKQASLHSSHPRFSRSIISIGVPVSQDWWCLWGCKTPECRVQPAIIDAYE